MKKRMGFAEIHNEFLTKNSKVTEDVNDFIEKYISDENKINEFMSILILIPSIYRSTLYELDEVPNERDNPEPEDLPLISYRTEKLGSKDIFFKNK